MDGCLAPTPVRRENQTRIRHVHKDPLPLGISKELDGRKSLESRVGDSVVLLAVSGQRREVEERGIVCKCKDKV